MVSINTIVWTFSDGMTQDAVYKFDLSANDMTNKRRIMFNQYSTKVVS